MDKRKLANVRVGRERTLLDEAEEESEMQSECACENVVRAYEWVNDVKENRARLVMEYCPEGSVLDEEETFERFRADERKAIARFISSVANVSRARSGASGRETAKRVCRW